MLYINLTSTSYKKASKFEFDIKVYWLLKTESLLYNFANKNASSF